MSLTRTPIHLLLLAAAIVTAPESGRAQVNVLANRYDNARTGANLQETVLNTFNVNVNQFGRLYSYTVDGAIYAQPLYVSGLTIAGARHNVLFVATMNDKVYAFDADAAGAPLWSRDFTNPANGITAVPVSDIVGSNSLNVVGNVGVESTPVIDLSSATMYLVARTKENGNYVQRLHALDITTGSEKSGSPVTITATISGTASDAVNGQLSFDPKMHNQRASLALTNGVVLISWGSHEDDMPYHGWIIGYDAATLQQVGVLCMTPNGSEGGIWQSGRAPAIDSAGYAYFLTGNGDWDGTKEFGDSVIKVKVTTKGLSIVDWFTPDDQSVLDSGDIDLGSTGAMLIPGSNVLVAGGKESILYLLNSNNLGHEASGNSQIIQTIAVNGSHFKGGPAFWNSPGGPLVYNWAQKDVLRAYHFNGTNFDAGVYAAGNVVSPGSPGGSLTVSANGGASGSGIVWAELSTSESGNHGTVAGVLRAFNAETLQELWNSELSPARDRLGTLVKFVAPVVVNGKVYAVTYDNALAVYGLLPGVPTSPDFNISGTTTATVAAGGTAAYSVSVAALNGFTGTVTLSVSGLPSGATASFNPASINSSGSSTLQVATTASTPTGTYSLTITGTSGSDVHSYTAQLTVSPAGSAATAISIDFVGKGTVMGSSEVAGVVAKAHWNSATGAASTQALALVDENGAATGASVTWTSDNTWSTSIADTPGNARMMKGYLDTPNLNPTVVNVTGLPASATGYDVYVYVDGDNPGALRTATYQISGPGITTSSITGTDAASTNFSGTFTQTGSGPGNYIKFTVNASTFTITATPGTSTDSYRRAPLNGIQIVPAAGTAPVAKAIGINFVGKGTAMGSSETAGVVAKAHWNSATGAASTQALALVDENGTATGASVTWTSDNTWSTTIADTPGNARMMKGYLDTSNLNPTTVTVSGLPASATGYDVYVYIDGDNPGALRTATYQISGPGITTSSITATDAASTNFSGTFTQTGSGPGNYIKFTINASGFTLTATPGTSTDSYRRAPLNGIQIVPSQSTAGPAKAVSVNFVGQGTPMQASEVAGVVAKANWNSATGAASTQALALVDENGTATGASVTWKSDNTWNTPIADTPGNARMMKGYLDTHNLNPTTVTVTGLPASANGYDVYVYVDGDNPGAVRTATYQISGPGITTSSITGTDAASTNFSATFTQTGSGPGNYIKFTVNASTFTITATPGTSTDSYRRAPLNGIQMVPAAGP